MVLEDQKEMFKKIPSVDRLLNSPDLAGIISSYPRNLILKAINEVLGEIRKEIEKGEGPDAVPGLNIDRVSKKVVETWLGQTRFFHNKSNFLAGSCAGVLR